MKNKLFLPLLITFLSLLVVTWSYLNISKKALVPSDEADYIWTGNQVSLALRTKNLDYFKTLTWVQFRYPPAQSWYLAFSLLPFEYTVYSSRLASLFLLIPTVIFGYLLSKKLEKSNLSSTIATFMILTSPAILFYFSSVMREGLAALLTLIAFFLYLLGREKKKLIYFVFAGIVCLILTLNKYNYGGLVIIAFGIESLFWLIVEKGYKEKFFWFANILLIAPLLVGMYVWVFLPVNRFSFLWPFPQSKDIYNLNETTLLGHLLYYPLELLFGYSFSWLAGLLLAIGFIYSLKDWKNYRLRVLAIFFLVNLFLAAKHIINDQARYIFTCVPVFFLVGSYGLVRLAKNLRKSKLKPEILGLCVSLILVVTVLLVKDLLLLPKMIPSTASHMLQTAMFYEQDYKNISSFNFNRSSWPHIAADPQTEKIEDLIKFALANIDLRKQINFIGCSNEFNKGLVSFYIDKAREKGETQFISDKDREYFVIVQTEKGGRMDTLDYRLICSQRNSGINEILTNKGLSLVVKKYSKDLGITLTILAKK